MHNEIIMMRSHETDNPSTLIHGRWGFILVHALGGNYSWQSHQEFYTLLSSVISLLEMYYKERIQRKGKAPHGKTSIAGLLIIVETMEII